MCACTHVRMVVSMTECIHAVPCRLIYLGMSCTCLVLPCKVQEMVGCKVCGLWRMVYDMVWHGVATINHIRTHS